MATKTGMKLKKNKSKVHSNSFVLSNISVLKKTNAELAKKLSICQMDSLAIQQEQHATWKEKIQLTLELKECKKHLLDTEKDLHNKNEIIKKLQNGLQDLMQMAGTSTEKDHCTANPKLNLEEKNIENSNIISSRRHVPINSFEAINTQCNASHVKGIKPSKKIQSDLHSVEEDVTDKNVLLSPKSESEKLYISSNSDESGDLTCFNENVFETINIKTNSVASEMDASLLDNTVDAIHLLPSRKRKSKAKKTMVRFVSEDNDISCINLEDHINKENESPSKFNQNIENVSPVKTTKYEKKSPSPLKLFLEETILGSVPDEKNCCSPVITSNEGEYTSSPIKLFLEETTLANISIDGNCSKMTNMHYDAPKTKRVQSAESYLHRPRRNRSKICYAEPSSKTKQRRPT